MELVTESINNATVVTPKSRHLDATNAAEFRRQMATEVAGSGQVVLALDHVEFLDSAGLGSLLSLLRRLTADGGDLRLCGVSPSVGALLQLVRLDQVIQIFESREEAAHSFDG